MQTFSHKINKPQGCNIQHKEHRSQRSNEKALPEQCFFNVYSNGAGNFTRTQTAGTNIYMAGRSVDNRLNALDIGLPCTIGTTMWMGNLYSKGNTLVAKLALCHPLHLLAVVKSRHCFVISKTSSWYNNRCRCKMQALFSKNYKFFSDPPRL